MDISIIICTHNRAESLLDVLKDIDNLIVPQDITWEALIVDNNSTDQTPVVVETFAKAKPSTFRYVFEGRQGKSYALNTGISAAKGGIIAFTDDDVKIDSLWLSSIKRIFDDSNCAGIGGRIIADWSFEKPKWLPTDGQTELMSAIVQFDHGDTRGELKAMPYGANMAFKKVMFEKYGMFRTDLGPRPGSKIYYEDTEFALRLKKGGERLIYAPEALVHHPVEKERADKRYYQSWYYGYGGALVRTTVLPANTVSYCGVPRYYFRQFLGAALRWIFKLDPKERFKHKLAMYLEVGRITEAYKLSRDKKDLPS
jgi:glucosyl-dolichyl phosphate glucuronosyltransferase